MRLLGRLSRAVTAAATVLSILGGVPVALWYLGGPLLPSHLPGWAEVVEALSRPDDGRLLLGLLVLVGVATWAVLALSILAEIASVLTRRPVMRVELPGFRYGRGVAAVLVAAILGLGAGPAATPAAAGPIAWTAPAVPGTTMASVPAEPDGPVHVVAPRDTLWRIAERALGDPLRWREIYDLNAGRPQPDGSMLTEASLLKVGWRLVLPSDAAARLVTVAPGDTLTGLAAAHLGDPSRAAELFEANRGRTQPNGAKLADPDVLHPGWTLTLPEPAPPPPAAPAVPPPPPPSTDQPAPGTTTAPPTSAVPQPSTVPTTPEPSAVATGPPAEAGVPDPADEAPSQGGEHRDDMGSVALPTALAASSLIIGGLLGALAVRRRRQLRARPAHHRVAVPPDAAGRLEWIGERTDPVADIAFLDAALRGLTLSNWDGIEVPPVRSVRLAPGGAVLTLASRASLPEPFVAIGDQDDWALDAAAELPLAPHEAGGYCAPFPTLVSVATDVADTTLLLDLEQLGVVRLVGHADRTTWLLRHMAAELANSQWAEDVEVLLVGFGTELVAINPERLRPVPDLASALAQVRAHVRSVRASVERLPVRSVLDGRLRDVAGDSWLPIILLAVGDPTDDERDDLDELAEELDAEQRLAAAVVMTGRGTSRNPMNIDDEGELTLRGVDGGPWFAESMNAEVGSGLAAILAPTSAPYEPAGPAVEEQAWTQDMSADGCLDPVPDIELVPIPRPPEPVAPRSTMVHHPRPDEGPPPVWPRPPEPTPDPDPASRFTSVDHPDPDTEPSPPLRPPDPAPDPEAVRRLAIVDHQDPDLDDDVQRWRTEDRPEVPLIAILGEPAVRAPGDLPSARPSWFTEILVYLSLHPAGVTIPTALTDLWPDGQKISTATVRHAFYGARRWAGRGLGGNVEKAFVSDMQTDSTYRIRGHLLDWDLFRRLRKRAQARHAARHPGAVADYQTALGLVRGPVLSALRHDGYAWLNNHDQRHDLQIPGFVVDAAHELVDIALAAGDTTLARRAAETARLVDIDAIFDRPLTDLMRIAHAEDNSSEMERYAAVLLDARGFEVPEELPPETFAVLNELLPTGPRRPRP